TTPPCTHWLRWRGLHARFADATWRSAARATGGRLPSPFAGRYQRAPRRGCRGHPLTSPSCAACLVAACMNERYGDCRTEFVFMCPGKMCAFRAGVAQRRLQAGIEAKGGRSVNTAFRRIRPAVCCLTAGALILAQVPMAQAASAMTRADYE